MTSTVIIQHYLSQPLIANPFARFDQYMPGEPATVVAGCVSDYMDFYHPKDEKRYMTCSLNDPEGVFYYVSVVSMDGIIQHASFYVNGSISFGDLLLIYPNIQTSRSRFGLTLTNGELYAFTGRRNFSWFRPLHYLTFW